MRSARAASVGGLNKVPARTVINWTRWREAVVSKWTPESEIKAIEDRVRKINSANSLEAALPTEVAPIDWASWEAKIKTPGVVAKIRAEYEQHATGAADAVDETVMAKRVTELNSTMDYWRRVAAFAKSERELHQEEFKYTLQDLSEGRVTAADTYKKHPGALKQLLEEVDKGYFFFTPLSDKMETVDNAALDKALEEGKVLPASFFANLGLPRKYADVDMEAELKAKTDKARAFGLEADFGKDLPQYLPQQTLPELPQLTGGVEFTPHPLYLTPEAEAEAHGAHGHGGHGDNHGHGDKHAKH